MSETLIETYIGAGGTIAGTLIGIWFGAKLSRQSQADAQAAAESFQTIMAERTDALLKAQHEAWMRKMDESVQGLNARLKTHAGEISRALRPDTKP